MRSLAIVALAAGCYAPEIKPGGACSTVCPLGQACIDGTCVDTSDGDPSLVAHWRFDDPPDDADGALDSSGQDHHAACTRCPTLVAGRIGGGYLFRDNDEHILVVPDHPDFRGVYTIAAWVYADSTHDQMALLSKPWGSATGNSWQLEVLDSDLVSLSGGQPHSLQSTREISTEVWHHLAGTWDGTTKRLFIDGVQAGSAPATVEYDDHAIYLGGDQNGGTEVLFWDGILDDLRVYRRVLGDDEIAELAR